MTACHSHEPTLDILGEDATNRDLVLLVAFFSLLQGHFHPVLHLLRAGAVPLCLSLHLRQFYKR
jgi:hypothetical protein